MTVYLLPNLLGPVNDHRLFLPDSVNRAVEEIDGLIAESEGEGRRFLKRFATKKKAHEMPIALLTKKLRDLDFLLEPIMHGEKWGVISDCGLPCLADPGSALVLRARQLNLPVETFSGPCSIVQALMLSGLAGQCFFFHGYLPKTPQERVKTLRQWEKTRATTHIFIEAPYRNIYTFKACIETLHPETLLCVASALSMPQQWIHTNPIYLWKEKPIPAIGKQPTIFLFYAIS